MEWLTLILILLAGFFVIYYFLFRKLGILKELGILHIKPLPIFGNLAPAFLRQCTFAEVVEKAYKLNDDAKYVGFYDFNNEPIIVIKSPELIKNIAIKYFEHFMDHRGFVDAEQDPLFGRSLFSLRGEKWKDMRNILSPAFTGSKMRAMFKLMSNCGKNFADYLSEGANNEPSVINSKDAFTRYTNDVIATCAFGISVDSMRNPKNEFYVLGREATNLEGIIGLKFFLIRSLPRIAKFFNVRIVSAKVEKFFMSIVRETIETREREGITRPDMIQLMMESRGNRYGDKSKVTILDMTSQAFGFFFGGFDTSSSLMCFVAHQISVNPNIQKKLHDEIDEIVKETNGELTYDAINGMQYLDAVINETLRIFPIVIFLDRICVKPYKLPPALPGAKTVNIEPGQNIWLPTYFIHRDPKYFRDPEIFDPERFVGSGKNHIDPFTYFPFGQGPRMCIANRFALLETKVLLFHLLAKCYMRPSAKMIVPLELSKSSFSMTAKGGFWLQLESRESISRTMKVSS